MLRSWPSSGVVVVLVACSGAAAPAPSSSSPHASEAPRQAPASGQAPGAPRAAKRAPCQSDQACNDDPSASALWGRCTELGVCECKPGFERNPLTDLCRPQAAE